MKKLGFTTIIPDLKLNEKIHIQYICAYDRRSNDSDNINSWIAIDEFKDNLEDWIGIE